MRNASARRTTLVFASLVVVTAAAQARAQERAIHTFERQQLTDVYYSEGIGLGDLNKDGHPDAVYGPLWFAGPDFKLQKEIYAPKPQNTEGYADHFFAWVFDFNGDGWNDVLTVGFPGKPAYVYENPGSGGHDKHWPKHEVFPQVNNESPQFTDIAGDARPELVCTKDGVFGYATPDPKRPFGTWAFHPISGKVAPMQFGHGLGVGDVDGDGKKDLIMKDGWFRQPESLDGDPKWAFSPVPFAPIGGADMHAYDVDGDGDNDVITSLAAHDFGLAWHEQVKDSDKVTFREHLIMGDQPAQNRYGVVFSEPHSVALADIDGDGLKDIVTGKTYYSHHKASPMWDAGAVVYWFRLVRGGKDGVDWVPYKADGEAGIGRQLAVLDLNGDGLLDIASGGMKGAHVLRHQREVVDEARWREAQPKPYNEPARPRLSGPKGAIDATTGRVSGVLEGEELTVLGASAGKTGRQKMAAFRMGKWSGGEQLVWTGAKPGDRLELELIAPASGPFDVAAALTQARDFGIVQLAIDGSPLGGPLDLYHYPDVLSTGEVLLGSKELTAGKHTLTVTIQGANASALKSYLFGLDYVRLSPR